MSETKRQRYNQVLIPIAGILDGDETYSIVVLPTPGVEILRCLCAYGEQRETFVDDSLGDGYYTTPDDTDWDTLLGIVSDVEERLMVRQDVGGRIQVTGDEAPVSGVGLELGYDGANGVITVRNRDAVTYKDLLTNALSYKLYLSGAQKAALTSAGFGLGVSSPGGLLEGRDAIGGFLFWSSATVSGSAITVIADGTGDVNRRLSVTYTITDKTTSATYGTFQTCDKGATAYLWSNPDCTVEIAVSANGSVTVQRTSGTHDAELAMFLVWA